MSGCLHFKIQFSFPLPANGLIKLCQRSSGVKISLICILNAAISVMIMGCLSSHQLSTPTIPVPRDLRSDFLQFTLGLCRGDYWVSLGGFRFLFQSAGRAQLQLVCKTVHPHLVMHTLQLSVCNVGYIVLVIFLFISYYHKHIFSSQVYHFILYYYAQSVSTRALYPTAAFPVDFFFDYVHTYLICFPPLGSTS